MGAGRKWGVYEKKLRSVGGVQKILHHVQGVCEKKMVISDAVLKKGHILSGGVSGKQNHNRKGGQKKNPQTLHIRNYFKIIGSC